MKCILPLLLLTIACGELPREGEYPDAPQAFADSMSAVDARSNEPYVRFRRDLEPMVSGVLVAGDSLRVVYDAGRLPECRGDHMGQPAWSITGFWRLNGAAGNSEGSFPAGGFDSSAGSVKPVIPLGAPGVLEIWFQVVNRWGCMAMDSNGGQNFRFEVFASPRTTVSFNADGTESTTGELLPGSVVRVEYALARLPRCRATDNGLPSWNITGFARIDSGETRTLTLTIAKGTLRESVPALVALPHGARTLELWFQNADHTGCKEWDSLSGRNYVYTLKQVPAQP